MSTATCRLWLFQSALPCGERRAARPWARGSACFNPRSPAESDNAHPCVWAVRWVSIRAPLRRATQFLKYLVNRPRVSIRAPLRRATSRQSRCGAQAPVSIRAPLRRATRTRRSRVAGQDGFNPRSPAESDAQPPAPRPEAVVSIRAPLRRATGRLHRLAALHEVSIRAPLRRATTAG